MKVISRFFLFGVLTLVLLTTACAGQQRSPTATATTQATSTPTIDVTSTSTITVTTSPTTTVTAVIPVTGPTTAELVCQFCMDTFTHALVVIPAAATFTVLSPTPSASTPADVSIGCNAVDRFRDRQIVLCRAPSNTSLSMDVCQGEDCHQFTVRLQICPPPTLDPVTPIWTPTPMASMTPTLRPPVSSPTSVISTATVGTPIATATVGGATPTITVSPTVTP